MKQQAQSVGIDVSKDKLDICILAGIGQTISGFQVTNTMEGVSKLEDILLKYQVEKEIPIVVESTADYHILTVLFLSEQGRNVKLINPIISGKQIQSSIRKVKSDKVDAKILAEMGIREGENLRKFTGDKEQVIIGKKLNLIHTLDKKRESMRKSLKSVKIVVDLVGGEEGEVLKAVEMSIKSLDIAIKKLKDELVKFYEDDEDLIRFDKISGISKESGSLILSFLKGKDFKSKKEMVAFCGLDVSVKESGKFKGNTKLSKRGNAYLRQLLFQAGWALKMHEPKFKELYEYQRNLGRHYYACLNILARKLVQILFGMLKNKTEFDPSRMVIPSH